MGVYVYTGITLPTGYTKHKAIEFYQSDGSDFNESTAYGYIDLSYKMSSTTKVVMDLIPYMSSGQSLMYGVAGDTFYGNLFMGYANSSLSVLGVINNMVGIYSFGSGTIRSPFMLWAYSRVPGNDSPVYVYGYHETPPPIGNRMLLTYTPKKIEWNSSLGSGSFDASANITEFDDTNDVWLFVNTTQLSSSYRFTRRLTNSNHNVDISAPLLHAIYYGFKVYNGNDELELNLIPATRDSDSRMGMYDIVNDTFYPETHNYGGLVRMID